MEILLMFVVATFAAFSATGVSIPVLRRAQVMDVPNARSSHHMATPRGGGVGVLLAISATVALGAFGHLGGSGYLGAEGAVVLLGGIAAGGLGLLDDLRDLSPMIRLVVQVVVAAVVSMALLINADDQSVRAGVILTVVGTFWLVGYLNAFNFMDGINGISAASAVVAGLWFAWLGYDASKHSLTLLGIAVAGGACGFLPWNAPRARVFLGDVGSYGLGMIIGGLAALAVVSGATVIEAIAPLVVYLVDTTWALMKRVARGDSPYQAHREHIYQRIVDGGAPHTATAGLAAVLAAASCGIATWLAAPSAILGLCIVAIIYVAAPTTILVMRRKVVQ